MMYQCYLSTASCDALDTSLRSLVRRCAGDAFPCLHISDSDTLCHRRGGGGQAWGSQNYRIRAGATMGWTAADVASHERLPDPRIVHGSAKAFMTYLWLGCGRRYQGEGSDAELRRWL